MILVWIKSLVMFKVPGSTNNWPATFPHWSQAPQLWLPRCLLGTQAAEALLSPHFALFSVGGDVEPPWGTQCLWDCELFLEAFTEMACASEGGLCQRRWLVPVRAQDPFELCPWFSVSLWPLLSFLLREAFARFSSSVPPPAPSWDSAIGDSCHPTHSIRWQTN